MDYHIFTVKICKSAIFGKKIGQNIVFFIVSVVANTGFALKVAKVVKVVKVVKPHDSREALKVVNHGAT